MKQLIPMDEYGVFSDAKDTARASSLVVAQMYGKRHDHVLRDIEAIHQDLIKPVDESNLPKSGGIGLDLKFGPIEGQRFFDENFVLSSYKDSRGRKQPVYFMSKNGFSMTVLAYTGAFAVKVRALYVQRFDEMERFIRHLASARMDFPLLTENIKLLHEHPRPYHFSNECDMLNRIVLGMTAKQYRQRNGIPNGESIRPYLTQEQITMLETLQRVDVGLLVAVPDYPERRRILEGYAARKLAA